MRSRPAWLALVAVVGIGCAPEPPATSPGAGAEPSIAAAKRLAGTEWNLVALDGQPTLPGHAITLAFAPDRLGGYAGCNWYGAQWTASGDRLQIGQAEATARACADPGPMTQESLYLARLAGTPTFRILDDRLVIEPAGPGQRLEFARRIPAAMDPAQLVGTRWRLRESDTPAGAPPIRIAFASDHITGFAGCRDFEATYSARGDAISTPTLAMATTECAADAAVHEREGQFTTDLGEAAHYAIAGDTLTLTTDGGRVLEFDREP